VTQKERPPPREKAATPEVQSNTLKNWEYISVSTPNKTYGATVLALMEASGLRKNIGTNPLAVAMATCAVSGAVARRVFNFEWPVTDAEVVSIYNRTLPSFECFYVGMDQRDALATAVAYLDQPLRAAIGVEAACGY
jgi:hypothetical protein